MAHALGKLSRGRAASQTGIRALIDRVVIGRTAIQIQLSEGAEKNDSAKILTLPWKRPSSYRKREIVLGATAAKTYARPMPANARAILIEALRDAHRWLDELLSDPRLSRPGGRAGRPRTAAPSPELSWPRRSWAFPPPAP